VRIRTVVRMGLAAAMLAAAVYGVAALTAMHAAYETERAARAFMGQFVALPVTTSTFADLEGFARRHVVWLWVGDLEHGHRFRPTRAGDLPPGCSADLCDLDFVFQNTRLERLGLAPLTDLSCEVQVRHGRTAYRIVDFVSRGTSFGFGSIVIEDFTGKLEAAVPGRRNIQKTIINLTPQSTATQRAQSYAFDLHCLAKIGGCKNSFELLPGPWKDENSFQATGAHAGR